MQDDSDDGGPALARDEEFGGRRRLRRALVIAGFLALTLVLFLMARVLWS